MYSLNISFTFDIGSYLCQQISTVAHEMFRHRQYLKVLFSIQSWWKMVRYLCWSLMGAVDVDLLESADDSSVMLVNFLFGAFLVMGVILLINMMIALLSNTYQKVQVG